MDLPGSQLLEALKINVMKARQGNEELSKLPCTIEVKNKLNKRMSYLLLSQIADMGASRQSTVLNKCIETIYFSDIPLPVTMQERYLLTSDSS